MIKRRRGAVLASSTDDEGMAAVEFALVLPFLVAMLFGIVVTGIVFIGRMQVQAAAREGARIGAVAPGGGCNAARQQLSSFSQSSVACSEVRSCTTTGNTVTVTVNQDVSIPVLGNRSVTLQSTSVYACQS